MSNNRQAGKKTGPNRKKRRRINRKTLWIFSGIVAVVFLWAGFLFFSSSPFEEGLTYLNQQESKEIQTLQKKIEAQRLNRLIASIDAGQADVFDFFTNSLILGDSRALGFSEYGYLPSDLVLAVTGMTAEDIDSYAQNIATIKPQYLYIALGANDIENGVGAGGENAYRTLLEEQIQTVLEESPDTKVVINSIMIPSAEVQQVQDVWEKTAEYNRQIQEVCQRNGWIYVNNDELAMEGYAPIYEQDGIHFTSQTYPQWALNMYEAVKASRVPDQTKKTDETSNEEK